MSHPSSGASRPVAHDDDRYSDQQQAIDASAKGPVLAFGTSAVLWLVVGLGLALLFHLGGMPGEGDASLGRASRGVMVYGSVAMAALGAAIWGWARMLGTPLYGVPMLLFGAAWWNLGVLIGGVSLLDGRIRAEAWLGLPLIAPLAFFVPALLFVIASLAWTLRRRTASRLSVAAWYVGLALLAGPALLIEAPEAGRGGWAMLGGWLAPFVLGMAYYLLVDGLQRRVYKQGLAYVGVGALLGGYSWLSGLVPDGGAMVGSLLLLTAAVVGVNVIGTVWERRAEVAYQPSLWFVVAGMLGLGLVGAVGGGLLLADGVSAFRVSVQSSQTLLRGTAIVFTFVLYGAFYHLMPRVTGKPWPRPGFVRLHVGMHVTGGGGYLGAILLDRAAGGGAAWLRLIGLVLMAAGALLFAYQFVRLLIGRSNPAGGPRA